MTPARALRFIEQCRLESPPLENAYSFRRASNDAYRCARLDAIEAARSSCPEERRKHLELARDAEAAAAMLERAAAEEEALDRLSGKLVEELTT